MHPAVLEQLIRGIFRHEGLLGEEFTVCWHAGEPLVTGIPYYAESLQRIQSIQQEYPHIRTKIQQSFQTNGILVDEAWCEFFKKSQARIGVSIDGPEALHDSRRRTRSGKGTHAKVVQAVHLLKKHLIDVHVISVISRSTLEDPDGFYEFFRDLGVALVGLNVEEIEDFNSQSSLLDGDVYASFTRFINRLFQRSMDDGHVRFREFEALRAAICGSAKQQRPSQRGQLITPFSIVSCDHLGNVSTFSPELLGAASSEYGNFIFGNVRENSFAEILEAPNLRRAQADIDVGIRRCEASCDYFSLCRGGSPSNKYFELGRFDGTQTKYCRHAKMAMIDAALDVLESRWLVPPAQGIAETPAS